uniref:Uncharacterized protein n=1 Tax=uncultured prokaryote TaxID=198431 RepID=A0A0H5Q784_9ZZZZ|nr:hypothetical protein [uncultured prokaryote]
MDEITLKVLRRNQDTIGVRVTYTVAGIVNYQSTHAIKVPPETELGQGDAKVVETWAVRYLADVVGVRQPLF